MDTIARRGRDGAHRRRIRTRERRAATVSRVGFTRNVTCRRLRLDLPDFVTWGGRGLALAYQGAMEMRAAVPLGVFG